MIRIWCKLAGGKYKVVGFDQENSTFQDLLNQVATSLGRTGGRGSLEIVDACSQCGKEETAEVDSLDLIVSRDKFLYVPGVELQLAGPGEDRAGATANVAAEQPEPRRATTGGDRAQGSQNQNGARTIDYPPEEVASISPTPEARRPTRCHQGHTDLVATVVPTQKLRSSPRHQAVGTPTQDVEASSGNNALPATLRHPGAPSADMGSIEDFLWGDLSMATPQQTQHPNHAPVTPTTSVHDTPRDQTSQKSAAPSLENSLQEKKRDDMAGSSSGSRLVLSLSCPDDDKYLTEYHQLLRKQLEIYEFDPAPGERKSTAVGAVGVRCVHCAHLPLYKKRGDAQSYPSKLEYLYDAGLQIALSHLPNCEQADEQLRDQISELKNQSVKRVGSKHYWLDCFRELGLYQAEDGLRFSKESNRAVPIIEQGTKVAKERSSRPAAKRKQPIKLRDYECSGNGQSKRSKPEEETTDNAFPTTKSRTVCLHLEDDDQFLTEYHTLIRKHLELFEYQDSSGVRLPGRGKLPDGIVGLRCNCCVSLASYKKAGLSVTFPSKLGVVYDSAMRIATEHLPFCEAIHDDIKEKIRASRDKKVKLSGRKQYWFDQLVKLGLEQTEDGLRFASESGD